MTLPLGDPRSGGGQSPQPHGRVRTAGRSASALAKALLGAAVVLASAGSLVSAGGAQAANNYSCAPRAAAGPGGFVNLAFSAIGIGDTVTCADKTFTVNSFDFGGNTGNINFEWVPVDPAPGYVDDLFSTDINFSPSIVGPQTGFFDYTVQITQPGWVFNTVQLDSAVAVNPRSPGDTSVIKEIRSGPLLNSINGAQVGPIPLAGVTSLSVRDTWSVAQGDVLTNVKDTFTQASEVPGPLPLLGAAAAFGWSRKLRSRMNPVARGEA